MARLLEVVHAVSPELYQRFAPAAFTAGNYVAGSAERSTGTVLGPRRDDYGGWRRNRRRTLVDALLAAASAAGRGLWRGR